MLLMLDEEYRLTRQRGWEEAGQRYDGLAAGPLADLMRQAAAEIFHHAGLAAGQTVLDVGTGPGTPALEAIPHVGKHGKVIGIDWAQSMVETARRHASEAGIGNAEFWVMEAEDLHFPDNHFDAVISRYGFPHFTSAARALAESHRVLKKGGRLAAAMHGAVDRNPYFTAPVLALQAFHLEPTSITDRGPFYFHEADRFEDAMRNAGFTNARAFVHDTQILVPDFEQYWAAQKAGGATVRRALDAVPEALRAEAEIAARNSLMPYVSGNEAVFPAQIVVGVGAKP